MSSSGSSGKKGAAATVLVTNSRTLLRVFLMVAISVIGGVLSLAYGAVEHYGNRTIIRLNDIP